MKESVNYTLKGLARIAFQAQIKAGMEQDVYIVPVGLDYVPYFKFRGNLSVHLWKNDKSKRFLTCIFLKISKKA